MENNLEIILNGFRSQVDINKNINLKLNFKQTKRNIPQSNLTETVNIPDVFKNERNSSSCYRFLGTVNVLASNVLLNWDGENSFADIIELQEFDEETGTYLDEVDEVLLEKDGWFFYQTGETCEKNFLEPVPDRFSILNPLGINNWDIWLTFPSEKDLKILTFNGIPLSDGIAIYSGSTVTIDQRQMTAFVCSINHNLQAGDQVEIKSYSPTGYEGTYNVYTLGFGDGTFKNNVFVLDVDIGTPPSLISGQTHFVKITQGVESKYYGRWFEKINKTTDSDVYPTAFANNYFGDQIYSYVFTEEYDLENYRDYLGRPLTDLYTSFVKKKDFNPDTSQYFWTNVESGIKTSLSSVEYDINLINKQSLNDSIEEEVNSTSNYLFGDIVEYNPILLEETVLEEAYHRFNSINRYTNGWFEGYYYKAHYLNRARVFGSYILEGVSGGTDVPDYAQILDGAKAIWREVLPNDYVNQENIPYLNGCHYINNVINLSLQRQNPCDEFDLGNNPLVDGKCVVDLIEELEEVEVSNLCE